MVAIDPPLKLIHELEFRKQFSARGIEKFECFVILTGHYNSFQKNVNIYFTCIVYCITTL
jgi:hypothetical protein